MKIKLFCAAGMSTSMLVNKMKKAAEAKGLDVFIQAYPESKMIIETNDCDVALLGPQVAYRLKESKEICDPKGVPVAVIPMKDYGMMNGEAVLEMALGLK